jgi:hypothetical protein
VASLERALSESPDSGLLAVGTRALARQFAVDFEGLSMTERDARLAALAKAGDRLLRAQRRDGSYDGSSAGGPVASTVAATTALEELRAFGIADTEGALRASSGWLQARRASDGRLLGAVGDDAHALSAVLAETEARLGVRRTDAGTAARLAARTVASRNPSSVAAGLGVLRSLGRPVAREARALLDTQRADGSFADAGVGPVRSTARGVAALTRAIR